MSSPNIISSHSSPYDIAAGAVAVLQRPQQLSVTRPSEDSVASILGPVLGWLAEAQFKEADVLC